MAYGMGFYNTQHRGSIYLNQVFDFDNMNDLHSFGQRNRNNSNINNSELFLIHYDLEYIPSDFAITTNNGSYKFNSILLKEMSLVIKNLLQEDQNNLQFHIDITDNRNIMKKLEDLFRNKKVVFYISDFACLHKIIGKLNIVDCPLFMQPENLQTNNMSIPIKSTIQFDQTSLATYLKSQPEDFTIVVNDVEYNCNSIGVYSSKKIREYLEKHPNSKKYEFNYDQEDEKDNFEIIKDLFGFNKVEITINNMNFLEKTAELLEIEVIIQDIKKFIDSYENTAQVIDDKILLIDTIDSIFEWLFNIDILTVEEVAKNIVESSWVQSEDEVKELASCFNLVINSNYYLSPFIIELLSSLSQKKEEFPHLEILIPFLLKKLIRSELKSPFIYKLYQKNLVTIKEIVDSQYYDEYSRISTMFLIPEIAEYKNISPEKLLSYYRNPHMTTYNEIMRIRDTDEPTDAITNTIFHDDVDNLQKIISNGGIDINSSRIPFNYFDTISYRVASRARNTTNCGKSLINYSAECGSIKCFKYLLLNHAELDAFSLSFAICGRNTEIIRTVDQNFPCSNLHQINKNDPISFHINGFNLTSPFIPAIITHQNNLFDWILEEKSFLIDFNDLNNNSNNASDIFNIINSISYSSNAHALIALIDRGLIVDSFFNNSNNYNHSALQSGFYKFVQLIFSFKSGEFELPQFLQQSFLDLAAISDNLSLFKFVIKVIKFEDNTNKKLDSFNPLINCINFNNFEMIRYIVENLFKANTYYHNFSPSNNIIDRIFQSAVSSRSTQIYKYLDEIFDFQGLINTNDIKVSNLLGYIKDACYKNNIKTVETLTDIILTNEPNTDFTNSFIFACEYNSESACQYFIDKKVFLNMVKLAQNPNVIKVSKGKIALYLISIAQPGMKDSISQIFLNQSIVENDKELVEIFLKTSKPNHDSLINAVKNHNLDIIKIILEKNSNPSFINELSAQGTVLNMAVLNNDLDIVQYLLSLPGINPDLYDKSNSTPLSNSILRMNFDIMNAILDFYGENVPTHQIQKGLEKLLELLSDCNGKNKPKGENKKVQKTRKSAFLNSVRESVFSIISRLMEFKSINLNCHAQKFTFLSYACSVNDIELAKLLLKSGRIDVNSFGPLNEKTPLMVSIENANIDLCKLLIDYPETNINMKNYRKETPLILAVMHKQDQIISYLIQSPKFDPIESCLNYAFFLSSGSISKLLYGVESLNVNYQHEEKVVEKEPQKSYNLYIYETSLIHAVSMKRDDVVDLIITHPSFDADESQLTTAIFVAVSKEQNNTAEELLKLCGNDVNIYNMNGNSLLVHSVLLNNKDFVSKILENDTFDPEKCDVLDAFLKAVSPISYYAINENTSQYGFRHNIRNNTDNQIVNFNILNALLEFDQDHLHTINFDELLPNGKSFFTIISPNTINLENVVGYFLTNGVDPNKPDKFGIYPLEYAIGLKSNVFVNALLQSDKIDLSIRVNKTGFYNETFLHLAARNKTFPEILSTERFDINVVDDIGDTPLIKACKCLSQKNVLDLFRRDELDFTHRNNDGDDALTVAKKSNSFSFSGWGSSGSYQNLLRGMASKEKAEYFEQLYPLLKNQF